MGWVNYVVIPSWKLMIEINRDVEELPELIEKQLDCLFEQRDIDQNDFDDIENVEISKLTVGQLATLASSTKKYATLTVMEFNHLLLYWLKGRKIEFYIISEYDKKIEDLKKKYKVIELTY